MNATSPPTPVPAGKKLKARRGVVIVAVLLVVTMLSLAAYQFGDLMLAEAKVSENAHRAVQTRAFADAGIHYAMALLSNSDSFNGTLGGNPYNNPQAFQNILIQGDNGVTGRFSIIGPPDPASGALDPSFGVIDECGKINIIAWMKSDPTGQTLHDGLVKLPNMTEEIANNIVAWMGGTVGVTNGGAQDDYYMSQHPAYRCKNGMPDSLDELLLVKGVTRDLLYGADLDRNGVQNDNESNTTNSGVAPSTGFDRGWSAFLTVHSREQNSNPLTGLAYINVNDPNIPGLYSALSAEVDDDLAKFIVMARTIGASPFASTSGSSSSSSSSSSSGTTQGVLGTYAPDLTKTGNYNITSLFALINVGVTVPTPTVDDKGKKTTVNVVYPSPLNDPAMQRDLLPKLFAVATLIPDAEIPARINVNTAPAEVLAAIPLPAGQYLADTDVQKIIQARQSAESMGDVFLTPTWLLTEAQLSVKTLQLLDSAFTAPSGGSIGAITTRSQVYRVQSVGFFDGGKGPAARVEAVIDVNGGRPRILAWRNLSDLGKGMITDTSSANGNGNGNQNPNQNP